MSIEKGNFVTCDNCGKSEYLGDKEIDDVAHWDEINVCKYVNGDDGYAPIFGATKALCSDCMIKVNKLEWYFARK
jgi:hypothetical protein